MLTTTLKKMDNHQSGVDLFGLCATMIYFIAGIFITFQSAVMIVVGMSTIIYNVLRIYNEFLRDGKWRTIFKKK